MKIKYKNYQVLLKHENIKIQFKAGAYVNCFKITPCLQVTYSGYNTKTGFAVEFTWGKWGIGWRFYNER